MEELLAGLLEGLFEFAWEILFEFVGEVGEASADAFNRWRKRG
jgi:hypothetical protein